MDVPIVTAPDAGTRTERWQWLPVALLPLRASWLRQTAFSRICILICIVSSNLTDPTKILALLLTEAHFD
jgi:hypothetical protein